MTRFCTSLFRISLFFSVLLVWGLASSPTFAAGAKIGVFPPRLSSGAGALRLPEQFLGSFTKALQTALGEAQIGELVVLPWPEDLVREDRPTYETLVNRGKEQGCSGVLALQLTERSFTKKDIRLPLVGKVSLAEASFGISGGLIDVASSVAIAPIKAESKMKARPYTGPTPDDALSLNVGDDDFDRSLLGQACADAIKQVVIAVQAGSPSLSPAPLAVAPRSSPPAGVGFGQDAFSMKMTTGYDKRATVSVVNRGRLSQSFIVVAKDVPKGLVVGLMGQGTVDGPCQLGPGQWKDIRLVVNSPEYEDVQSVKLALYIVEDGKVPSFDGDPDDTTMMNLQWEMRDDATKLVVVGQDPVTLAYTCQIQNNSDHDIWGMRLEPRPDQSDLVEISPRLENARIPANGSLTFRVIPRLMMGLRKMDVVLQGKLGNAQDKWPFHFAVPEGKSVYLGMAHTSESSGSAGSGCTNQGEINIYGASERGITLGYVLGKIWHWINPDPYQKFEVINERVVNGVRGATIRSNVSARLPNMDTDSLTNPMGSSGKDRRGFVYFTTGLDKLMRVIFVRQYPSENARSILEPIQLSEDGHNARWPYIRTRWSTSQSFVVWEDSTQGKRSNVAFRGSNDLMKSWQPVQYLTSHGRGVDDPVVIVNEKGVVMVVWNDLRDGSGQIYLRISQDNGKTFATEVAVPRAAGESQAWPQIDFVPGSGFVLVYVSRTKAQTQILTRGLDNQGKPRGDAVVLSNPNTVCGEPQIAFDENGKAYAVWREGDGDQSEVWFSRSLGDEQPWIPARQITTDKVYSEYPQIWLVGKSLYASYHSESGGADLKYLVNSVDGGDTWGERITQPSLEDVASRAYVEINFSLQNPRSTYRPHNTTVFLNGVQIGKLENTIPEGTYIWEAPPGVARSGAQAIRDNYINLKVDGLNRANYILAANSRLVIKRRFTQLPVVASSQAEADRLAQSSGMTLNHSAPDLALAANAVKSLPAQLTPGQKVELPLHVYNIGEGAASDVRVCVYAADPRDPLADLKSLRLAEFHIGTVQPGEVKPATVSFKYDPSHAPRVYAAVYSKEKDFNEIDNIWGYSFTKGASDLVSPLFGTDIPDVLRAPDLMGIVSIPDLQGLVDLVSLPGLDRLVSKAGLQAPNIQRITDSIKGNLGEMTLPNIPGLNIKKLVP